MKLVPRRPSAAARRRRWSLLLVAPLVVYPVFLMKLLCFALLAASLNLLVGYVGLLSFGHAMFFGSAGLRQRRTRSRCGASTSSLGIAARRGRGGRARRRHRPAGDPPPGHRLLDDHAGVRAAGLLHRAAARPSPAARTASRTCRAAPLFGLLDLGNNLTLYYVVLAIVGARLLARSTASCIRRSARC